MEKSDGHHLYQLRGGTSSHPPTYSLGEHHVFLSPRMLLLLPIHPPTHPPTHPRTCWSSSGRALGLTISAMVQEGKKKEGVVVEREEVLDEALWVWFECGGE